MTQAFPGEFKAVALGNDARGYQETRIVAEYSMLTEWICVSLNAYEAGFWQVFEEQLVWNTSRVRRFRIYIYQVLMNDMLFARPII